MAWIAGAAAGGCALLSLPIVVVLKKRHLERQTK
jgi:hypothetical protein